MDFNTIPVNVRTPGAFIEIDNSAAVRGLVGMPSRILVIGQKLAAGTAAADTPIRVLDERAAEAYFGRGSMLHRMFRTLKAANNWTETWGVPLEDDGAGQAATGAIDFGGAPTGAGTLNLWIGGQRVRVGVAITATATSVAAAVAAAITAATDLPVTAAVNGGDDTKVDLTARHKGETGNDVDVRINYYPGETMPPGLTADITAMNGGTGNPDIADALAAMGDTWYTDLVCAYTDAANLAALEAELEDRWGPMKMQDGSAYCGARGTHAALTTLGNSRNSPHVSIMGADSSPTPPVNWAASFGGVGAYFTKIDPVRPLQTLVLPGVLPPAEDKRFTQSERNLLLFDGISTFTVDDGGQVRLERAITTYETNAYGVEDPSLLDLVTMKTNAFIRYQVRARVALRFPRHKVADDGTRVAPGSAIVTPLIIRAELISLFRELEAAGIIENLDQFIEDLIVERDPDDPNRVNAILPPDLVNQFRVFAAKLLFRL